MLHFCVRAPSSLADLSPCWANKQKLRAMRLLEEFGLTEFHGSNQAQVEVLLYARPQMGMNAVCVYQVRKRMKLVFFWGKKAAYLRPRKAL